MSNRREKRKNNIGPSKIWFWSLAMVFLFGLFSYGYCVQGSIVNIVARQNVENKISILDTRVLELEAQYIKAKNGVTRDLAENLGYIEIANQKFVTRKATDLGLSLVNPGI